MPEQRTAQNRIDVVILWVDGSDPAWQAEKARVCATPLADDRNLRYRDWGLLPYLFRGLHTKAGTRRAEHPAAARPCRNFGRRGSRSVHGDHPRGRKERFA